jgi:GTPase SAR1 family protein
VPIYVRDAFAAVLVYDVTNQKSFDDLDHWRSVVVEEQSDEVVIFVVCNKIDLPHAVVSEEQAVAFSQNVNAKYCKVSAASGVGISDLFEAIAQEAAIGRTHQTEDAPPLFHIEQGHTRTGNCC